MKADIVQAASSQSISTNNFAVEVVGTALCQLTVHLSDLDGHLF